MKTKENSLVKEIDDLVDKYSGPKLWRATVRLAVMRNPKIANDVLLTIRDNRELRQGLNDSKYGVSKDKSMRHAIRIPESVDDLLCIVDPDTFPLSQHKPDKVGNIIVKMQKVLPEFFLPERL